MIRPPHHDRGQIIMFRLIRRRLDLLDVVRVAGDERRCPEPVEFSLREALDLAEDRAPDVAPEGHARLRAPVDGDDRGDHDDERDAEH
jgi:hypothetical protein